MNAATSDSSAAPGSGWSTRLWREWEQFWFRPADPTRLGLIRIGAGLVTLYTFFCFSLDLQAFLGDHAWIDVQTRLYEVRNRPNDLAPLLSKAPPPSTPAQERYYREYVDRFQEAPPGPYPRNEAENKICIDYRTLYGVDLRKYGMPIPRGAEEPGPWSKQTEDDVRFLEQFAIKHAQKLGYADAPAPPYPRNFEEKREILDYLEKHGKDLHRLASKGEPSWSLWFYVTEPTAVQCLQALVLCTATLFTLGCCTKITAPLTWFFNLNYFFRTPYSAFGADSIINMMLLYLMLGPCGAALSVDRLFARWWSRNRLAVVNRWRSWWGKPALSAEELRPAAPDTVAEASTPRPLIGSNVVLRLMQVHLCIIYLIAGLTKFSAVAWWNGTGIWPILAQPELAPLHVELYNDMLRFLARHEFAFFLFLYAGTTFTLVFEVGYAFLIWTRLRRLFLVAAVLLHALIGVMGLPTFALIMLVMNAAFLTDAEVDWFVGLFPRLCERMRRKAPSAIAEARVP